VRSFAGVQKTHRVLHQTVPVIVHGRQRGDFFSANDFGSPERGRCLTRKNVTAVRDFPKRVRVSPAAVRRITQSHQATGVIRPTAVGKGRGDGIDESLEGARSWVAEQFSPPLAARFRQECSGGGAGEIATGRCDFAMATSRCPRRAMHHGQCERPKVRLGCRTGTATKRGRFDGVVFEIAGRRDPRCRAQHIRIAGRTRIGVLLQLLRSRFRTDRVPTKSSAHPANRDTLIRATARACRWVARGVTVCFA